MLEFIQSGGTVMYILVVLSVIGLALVIERFIVLHRIPSEKVAIGTLERVGGELTANGVKGAAAFCNKGGGVLNYIFATVLKKHDILTIEERGEQEMKEELTTTVTEAGTRYLGRFLDYINTIAVIAPLLGLFGTIIGMIVAFGAIAKAGTGDPQVVASGIRVALLTTAGGLSIAIPLIVLHRYLAARADYAMERLGIYGHVFVNMLLRRSKSE